MESIGRSLNTDLILNQLQNKSGQLGLGGLSGKGDDKAAESTTNVVGNFSHMLQDQLEKLNQTQVNADQAVQTYAVGGPIELHDVVAATDKAELSMQLALQVRNKMISAYQEISRMSV